jgi:Fur family ferric uptake transcriptional regulator
MQQANEIMTHTNLDYIDTLHKNGYRITKQRQNILDAICLAEGHATIGEIYYRARKFDENIDRSTIYRSLELFVKLGLVIIANNFNGSRTYELVQDHNHHHLICTLCRNEIEIDNKIVDNFYQQMGNNYNFNISMDHLIVYGICAACAD